MLGIIARQIYNGIDLHCCANSLVEEMRRPMQLQGQVNSSKLIDDSLCQFAINPIRSRSHFHPHNTVYARAVSGH